MLLKNYHFFNNILFLSLFYENISKKEKNKTKKKFSYSLIIFIVCVERSSNTFK